MTNSHFFDLIIPDILKSYYMFTLFQCIDYLVFNHAFFIIHILKKDIALDFIYLNTILKLSIYILLWFHCRRSFMRLVHNYVCSWNQGWGSGSVEFWPFWSGTFFLPDPDPICKNRYKLFSSWTKYKPE